jgi:monoterpene epsilon-lactone hydrolase
MAAVKNAMFANRRAAAGAPVPTIEESRAALEARFGGLPPIEGASYAPVDLGGVTGEWTMPESPTIPGTLLYFHGGAYFMGSIATHRRLVTSLCTAAKLRGLSVAYRLAPEHPFPAAVEDALTAYRWLIGAGGEDPRRVVLAGDSAGGGLALATMAGLRDAGDALPAGAVVVSAWTDLTCSGESMRSRAEVDPFLLSDGLRSRVGLYLPEGDPRQPLASPLFADLAGLPPMLVQVGEAEILYDDSARLVETARAAGVEVDFQVWSEAFHVFPLMVGLIPEADEAVANASDWITRRLDA